MTLEITLNFSIWPFAPTIEVTWWQFFFTLFCNSQDCSNRVAWILSQMYVSLAMPRSKKLYTLKVLHTHPLKKTININWIFIDIFKEMCAFSEMLGGENYVWIVNSQAIYLTVLIKNEKPASEIITEMIRSDALFSLEYCALTRRSPKIEKC